MTNRDAERRLVCAEWAEKGKKNILGREKKP